MCRLKGYVWFEKQGSSLADISAWPRLRRVIKDKSQWLNQSEKHPLYCFDIEFPHIDLINGIRGKKMKSMFEYYDITTPPVWQK